MNNVLILLDKQDDWKPYCESNSVLEVCDYLKNDFVDKEHDLVINLSSDYSYNSEGYYCSLLAQARKQKIIPSVDVINKIETERGVRMDRNLQKLCYQWIQKNNIKDDIWYMNIFFGKSKEKELERIARFIFDNYPSPILRIGFNTKEKEQIESIDYLPLNKLDDKDQDFFAATLDEFNKRVWREPKLGKKYKYSLAILYDPKEKFPPSNPVALNKLISVAKKMDIHAELITEDDIARLMEYDALFIRTTTSLNHYTFHFAQLAAENGLAVIDDPTSIIRCTNKVYLKELFQKQNIATPKSSLIFRSSVNKFEDLVEELALPIILKIPDGSFSIGMKKVSNEKEFNEALDILFRDSSIILAQEFTPTEFDWRIGVLNGEPLFACKYFMAKGHWQIYNHYDSGVSRCGVDEAIPIYKVPKKVLDTALKATSFVGKGLYGVDIKVFNKKAIVIEINDNPNIDHGFEDALLGDDIYYRILHYFEQSIAALHH